ncbi:hypothetical protein [Kallotenue papyrolyticum]|uniref:hypothetical protein n=1 Tax=Kallotenue papyrolyticum TaxID=1325125 RepID=UPI0004786130|nr:hypothetical protein [Kallotenue papyrolyticum]
MPYRHRRSVLWSLAWLALSLIATLTPAAPIAYADPAAPEAPTRPSIAPSRPLQPTARSTPPAHTRLGAASVCAERSLHLRVLVLAASQDEPALSAITQPSPKRWRTWERPTICAS